MDKAILVMDMPKQCIDCKLSGYTVTGIPCCKAYGRFLDTFMSKPTWCPLCGVPEKDRSFARNNAYHYQCGWNACIDAILGGKQGG